MFKYSAKTCFQEGAYPTLGFPLKTQRFCVLWTTGKEDLAVISFCVHYPSGKTCVLEHLGRVTVSWNWVWALVHIEPQPTAAVALPVPAERRSLIQICLRPRWYWRTRDREHRWFITKFLVSAFPPWICCHSDACVLPSMPLSPLRSISYTLSLDLMFVFWSTFSGS